MELVQVTVLAAVTYFMFGFQATAAKFFIYTATLVVFTLCSETLGYMAAIATPDSKIGVAVISMVLLVLLSFNGFMVSLLLTPKHWQRKLHASSNCAAH